MLKLTKSMWQLPNLTVWFSRLSFTRQDNEGVSSKQKPEKYRQPQYHF
ncbi:MAG: hypothetical protein IPH28_19965 [Cytophagaceae bacterium]|nr:hypothetical protein [Cytophagaceae bacterium]